MNLRRILRIIIPLWVVAQTVIVIAYFGMQATIDNDSFEYIRWAQNSYLAGTIYPSAINTNDLYVQSIGMVNYLLLQIIIFGTVNLNPFLNILLNIGILWEIYYLGKRFFDLTTARLSVLLFCLLLSTVFQPLHSLTETPFLFLCLSGFCLGWSKNKKKLVCAGIIYAIAFTFRPLALAFVLATCLNQAKNRKNWLGVAAILIPMAAILLAVGLRAKNETGTFVTSSSTGGINLMMTANDLADGTQQLIHFYENPKYLGFIENMDSRTFHEKDSIWKTKATRWILDHPADYARLYLRKWRMIFYDETFAFPFIAQNFQQLKHGHLDEVQKTRLKREITWQRIACNAVYFLILLLFIAALVVNHKDIFTPRGYLLLIFLLGIGTTCLFIVEPRYHYPFLFVPILFAANLLGKAKPLQTSPKGRLTAKPTGNAGVPPAAKREATCY